MDEKRFLKKLNSKDNRFGTYTYREVEKLINNNRLMIEYPNIFEKIINYFRKIPKSAEQIIRNNFKTIIEKVSDADTDSLIMLLVDNKNTFDIIETNIHLIFKKIFKNTLYLDAIYTRLDKSDLLQKNLDFIIENSPHMEHIYYINQILKKRNKEVDMKLNNFIKSRKIEYARFLLEKRMNYKKNFIDDYSVTLSIMIDELLESERSERAERVKRGEKVEEVSYIDIEEIGKGAYSDVYRIGEKVLKIGGPRETYNIPNHRRILQPLTRTNFIDEKYGLVVGCVEICNRAAPVRQGDRKKEKLYELYKELREKGIIWVDAKFENIGVLLTSNITTLNGEEMDVAPNSVGFNKNISDEEPLKKGDWVIIDTDYIYLDTEQNIEHQLCGYSLEFEHRYQQEKYPDIRKKKVEEFVKNMNIEDDEFEI